MTLHQPIPRYTNPFEDTVTAVYPTAIVIDRAGELLAVADMLGYLRIYDITTLTRPRLLDKTNSGPAETDQLGVYTGLAFHPTWPLLVGASMFSTTVVFDIDNPE